MNELGSKVESIEEQKRYINERLGILSAKNNNSDIEYKVSSGSEEHDNGNKQQSPNISGDVILKSIGNNKMDVMKYLKQFTGLSLKDVKDMVENLPALIYSSSNTLEIARIQNDLSALGAIVELK